MHHEEIEIAVRDYVIKADIKIPSNTESRIGVILAHGAIVNRKSLLRAKHCLGEYLCKELGAYIISTKYLVEKYNLTEVMGFGHSMGSYILTNALPMNRCVGSIINYGGPINDLQSTRQRNFVQYLITYLNTYDYNINIRKLVKHIFDKETSRYLIEVMLKDKNYGYQDFTFDSQIVNDIINTVDQYFDTLKQWGKPVLLLFGTNDTLTKKTSNYYEDNSVEDNITIKHLQDASHVTPCMESIFELSKLNPAIKFYAKNHNIDIEQRPKTSPIISTAK